MESVGGDSFLYFGFGSNLLAARIHIQNPSAKFHTIARLLDYRLGFEHDSVSLTSPWFGASATVIPSVGDHVWGVVWLMKSSDVSSLDDQEGVHLNIYKPITVEVTASDGAQLECRTYVRLTTNCIDRRPSPQYLDVIINGALEHQLPQYYIDMLRSFEHNGYTGSVQIYEDVMARHRRST